VRSKLHQSFWLRSLGWLSLDIHDWDVLKHRCLDFQSCHVCTCNCISCDVVIVSRPIAAVFSSISEHPVAAASLGQASTCQGFYD